MRYYVDTNKVTYEQWVKYMSKNMLYHCDKAEQFFSDRYQRYFFFNEHQRNYGHSDTTPHTHPNKWTYSIADKYIDLTDRMYRGNTKVGGKLL